eukprot:jgi/Chrzof1/5962/Cz16g21320.t1
MRGSARFGWRHPSYSRVGSPSSTHPLTLSFSSKDLERRYRKHQWHILRDYDRSMLFVYIVVHATYWLTKFQDTTPECRRQSGIGYTSAVLLHCVAYCFYSRRQHMRWRTPLMLLLKSLYGIAFTGACRACTIDGGDGLGTFIKRLFVSANIYGLTVVGVGLPVSMFEHITAQTLAVLSWGTAVTPDVCKALTSPLQPLQQKYLRTVISYFEAVYTPLLAHIAGTFGPMPDKESLLTRPVAYQCHVLLTFLQLTAGWLLPLLLQHRLEYMHRMTFLDTITSEAGLPSEWLLTSAFDDDTAAGDVGERGLAWCLDTCGRVIAVAAFMGGTTSMLWGFAHVLYVPADALG